MTFARIIIERSEPDPRHARFQVIAPEQRSQARQRLVEGEGLYEIIRSASIERSRMSSSAVSTMTAGSGGRVRSTGMRERPSLSGSLRSISTSRLRTPRNGFDGDAEACNGIDDIPLAY